MVWLAGVVLLITVTWSGFATGIKRLHDREKSGWWILLFWLGPSVLGGIQATSNNPTVAMTMGFGSSALAIWGLVELGFPARHGGAESLRSRSASGRCTGAATLMSDTLSIARDLLRCRSVTPADDGALGVLEALLKHAGFETHRVTFSEEGAADIDNLYARIGTSAPHITFAGHTDVVPPGNDAAWTHGAFSGDVKDGFLYGRGAVDMKGGIACSVAAVLDYLAAHDGQPRTDGTGSISFLITGDEEDVAVNGTVKLLQWVGGARRNLRSLRARRAEQCRGDG